MNKQLGALEPGGRERRGDGSCRPTRGPHPNQATTEGDPFWLTQPLHLIYQTMNKSGP